jgi:hypothetical protein
VDAEQIVRRKWRLLKATLDERGRRLWAGAEADAIGRGGVAQVARATRLAISTVRKGRDEVRSGAQRRDVVNVRRSPGNRPFEEANPEVWPALEKLVDPLTRGDPESPLRWTCKSTHALSAELFSGHGIRISDKTVAKLLREHGYSLQAPNKSVEGAQHPDRNAQFEHINAKAQGCIKRGIPVISVDTKKKELVGDFKNGGRELRPKGQPAPVRVHDFAIPELGKAVPYGIYDVSANAGFVNVGISADTGEFSVASIRRWWYEIGVSRYPAAKQMLINADCGGSNGARLRLWKRELQGLADELRIEITVCHVPTGTSKWNKIEHRLFSFISQNWRGKPLVSYLVIVQLIASTTTKTGLTIACRLDESDYAKGIKVTDAEMDALNIQPAAFHGEWNYTIAPRTPDG